MNALIEMARRGYRELNAGESFSFTDGNGNPYAGGCAIKAANGASAELKVTNIYGDSSSDDIDRERSSGNLAGANMILIAGEIELTTASTIEVVSGTVRVFIDSNPPV